MTPDQFITVTNTLTGLVTKVEGINDRLDKLNGKVADHEKGINTLIIWKARAEGFGGAIKVGWGTIITLASGAFALFAYWTSQK